MHPSEVPPQFAEAPFRFAAALHSIQATHLRPGIELEEIPAPIRTAPYAVAIEGAVTSPDAADDANAFGRYIVLYDPDGQPGWQGEFRVVTVVKADLDQELANDPMLADIAWSWVVEALHGIPVRCLGGTVTQLNSASFGELDDDEHKDHSTLEIRASWTPPDDQLGKHLNAWANVLATAAGLAPALSEVAPDAEVARSARQVTPINSHVGSHRRNHVGISVLT